MSLDPRILREALAEQKDRRHRREEEYRARRRQVYALEPRLEELVRERRGTVAGMVSAALRSGGDPEAAAEQAKAQAARIRVREEELLTQLGFPPDYLEERPVCPHCGDTGYVGTRPCQCLLRLYARRQQEESVVSIDPSAAWPEPAKNAKRAKAARIAQEDEAADAFESSQDETQENSEE